MIGAKTRVAIVGGIGYIGSCFASFIKEQNDKLIVTVIDNNKNNHVIKLLKKIGIEFYFADLLDRHKLTEVIAAIQPDVVFHFAAKTSVSESVHNPLKYFDCNVIGTLNLISAISNLQKPIKLFFASSAAVYGQTTNSYISEEIVITETQATNPYGLSKFLDELILNAVAKNSQLQVVCLRFFNVAGAILPFGNFNGNTTLLIPNLVKAFLKQTPLFLYGNDYATKDGSCIRDYIHVYDICNAHFLLWKWLNDHRQIKFETFNLGSGIGTSNLEVIDIAKKVFYPSRLNLEIRPKRSRDPAILVANVAKAKQTFQFKITRNLKDMISDERNFYENFYNDAY